MSPTFSNLDSATVILAGARTPTGKYRGALASLTAADLGAVAIRARWNERTYRRTRWVM